MARPPLELPPIPPTDCFQAKFVKVLISTEVADFNSLNIGDTELNGLYVVDEALLKGRERRLKMMSDYLIDYIIGCEACVGDKESAECPMRQSFDFIVGTLVTIDEDN